jgi:hypothetical protein
MQSVSGNRGALAFNHDYMRAYHLFPSFILARLNLLAVSVFVETELKRISILSQYRNPLA